MELNVKPCNRHLLVEEDSPEENQEEVKFVLPDDYIKKDPFTVVKVLDFADDCEKIKKKSILAVVPTNMIETIVVNGNTYKLVQENYVNLILNAGG